MDYAGKHYLIDAKDRLQWALAIDREQPNVSVDKPPDQMYAAWTGFNGPVTSASRRSIVHEEKREARAKREDFTSMMGKYMKMSEQSIAMKMAEKMAEQVDNMGSSRRRSPPQAPPPAPPPAWASWQPPPWQQQQQYQYQQGPQPSAYWPQQPQHVQQPHHAVPEPEPAQKQKPTPEPAQKTPPERPEKSATAAASSPIGSDDEDDIIEQFFAWKITNTKKDVKKAKIQLAAEIVTELC